jgi:uncharacterized membrane protein YfcA
MTTKLIFQEFSLLSLSSAEVSYCFIVIVLAYALRGGTGFGAAIAMPLLALVLPMKTLVPAWSVLSVVAGIDILRRDYDKIAWADLMPLMPGCLLGIVVGLAFYKLLDSPTLTRGLGLLVVLYGAFSLRATMRPPQEWQMPPKSIARLSGLMGGAIGTTFGALTSLSFAMYFDAIRMPVDQFRGTMSAALVAMGLVRALGYFGLAEFTADVWLLLAITLPMTLIGIYLGNRLFAEVSEMRFRRLVSLTLIVSGFALLAK